jgi:hypothetical protein
LEKSPERFPDAMACVGGRRGLRALIWGKEEIPAEVLSKIV